MKSCTTDVTDARDIQHCVWQRQANRVGGLEESTQNNGSYHPFKKLQQVLPHQ